MSQRATYGQSGKESVTTVISWELSAMGAMATGRAFTS